MVLDTPQQKRARHIWGRLVIAVTIAICALALFWRQEIRAHYWALRLSSTYELDMRAAYLTALCNLGSAARGAARRLLAQEDTELRSYGILILQALRDARSRADLLPLLSDPDPALRRLAAVALAAHQHDDVVPALATLLRTSDADTVRTAALTLERLGTPAAVELLARVCTELPTAEARAAAADALGGIGRPEAVPALVALLEDHAAVTSGSAADEAVQKLLGTLALQGWTIMPTTLPATGLPPTTVAERAAVALQRITGLVPPFASSLPTDERGAAQAEWAAWVTPPATTAPAGPPAEWGVLPAVPVTQPQR